MRKLVLVLGLVAATVSCKKEDVSPSVEAIQDCNCDRVVKVMNFNIVNSADEGGTTTSSHIFTVNDCTNFNKKTIRSFSNSSLAPKVGECYQMPY